ncbi:ergothioneine biosynthesis glutamate--cysteine ligase EgtA [Hoyosella sp. G463]|uniref:Glutamate--cysteine ligase EgtA n=1 Tax=Lolliginicoccus lacisalsi TaxID=2742202 RepID=A0A927JCM9_9ACTN|nr:glutamate-cysteine ligase family protein [Lolliginicoccus lacisalsi]MBD8506774.1 ergothioneine biosynthesis glutamate--cysteine ligase EgtA [Lolliginicoccus lacisalsi]
MGLPPLATTLPADPARIVPTREAAHELITNRVTATSAGPTVGAEIEWLVLDPSDPGRRPAYADIRAALGPWAPPLGGRSAPLPGGSVVTIEPGGQIELSSAPSPTARELLAALHSDARLLAARLHGHGLVLGCAAADTGREPKRILDAPRYRAMEAVFDRNGPMGRIMMNNTAAVQPCVGPGTTAAESEARWQMLNAIGPALIAAFAASPRVAGGAAGQWASQRMRAWFTLDPARTRLPAGCTLADGYATWALEVPLLCVRSEHEDWAAPPGLDLGSWIEQGASSPIGRAPAVADVDYHLTTLFPPVRPKGFFEIRYLDQQPDQRWDIPVAVVAALVSSPGLVDRAHALAEPTATSWARAARLGTSDPALARAAGDLLMLAAHHCDDTTLASRIEQAARRRNTTARAGAT